ncbi:hypothetical protein [Sphingobium aromaticiconvertens]|uniref:hypothetical protein n=1 Tax=Sphingobium aromaticiconvertens TaxID=365341 RepID=UPI0030184504
MEEPWFRSYGPIMLLPIRWQGWLALIATFIIFFSFCELSEGLAAHPVLSVACLVIAAATGIAFFVLAFWKLDRRWRD